MAWSKVYLVRRSIQRPNGKVYRYWDLRWRDHRGKFRSKSVGRIGKFTWLEAEALRSEMEKVSLNQRPKPSDRQSRTTPDGFNEFEVHAWLYMRLKEDLLGLDAGFSIEGNRLISGLGIPDLHIKRHDKSWMIVEVKSSMVSDLSGSAKQAKSYAEGIGCSKWSICHGMKDAKSCRVAIVARAALERMNELV